MKQHLLNLAAEQPDPRIRLNTVREYLQAHILASLQDAGAFAQLAFQGGTALRFLHNLRRYSEDLDFSLDRSAEAYDVAVPTLRAKRDLELAGYAAEASLRTDRTVQSASIRLPGLLREVGLTPDPRRKLQIRLEVDTCPPAGAVTEQRLVTRHFPLVFRAYDLPSCMTGKLHALLARSHVKGRDVFDLAWYLTHPARPRPNLDLLGHALEQTGWTGPLLTEANWPAVLTERMRTFDWSAVVRDVEPFLEEARDMRLLDRELLLKELSAMGG